MTDDAPAEGGRVFFSSRGRSLMQEDEIRLTSVGVDIGSSTSHLVFSRIVLERLDARYVIVEREAFHYSGILLTPYLADSTIDAARLGGFIEAEYAAAGVSPGDVDTGALVLTGVAVRRANAQAIGELFAAQAGKMVAVSAGDSLETVMAAYGSGAVARSIRQRQTVMNVDIGGGTAKIAVAARGEVVDRTAVDIGARIVSLDDEGRIVRLEEAARWYGRRLGLPLEIGAPLSPEAAQALTAQMADDLIAVMRGRAADGGVDGLLRLEPLSWSGPIDVVTVSGGVSEYVYGSETQAFGDLGPLLAAAFRERLAGQGLTLAPPDERIRATVIGASQYTTQLSGGTIFIAPDDALPLRNLPVIAPELPLDAAALDPAAIAGAIRASLKRMELDAQDRPVALFVRWRGSASFARLDSFCRGVAEGMAPVLTDGRPLVLAGDGDVGGLIGIHLKEELRLAGPVVSVDGLDLKAFDFIDIGEILESSGAAPVVIKSLVFPTGHDLGRPAIRSL